MNIEKEIMELTNDSLIIWVKEMLPLAPDETKKIIDQSRLDWVIDLTNELFIIKELDEVTNGRIILLNTILGSLTESWLKFFYSVYYDSYSAEDTKINKKKDSENKEFYLVPPNELSFEKLRQFSNLVFDKMINEFVQDAQNKRNMIHSFNNPRTTEIGSIEDFQTNLIKFLELIKSINSRLPEIIF